MSEPGTEREEIKERFRRIYGYLNAIADEVTAIRRTHIMIMSGSDLHTMANVEGDERDLERDVHYLEKLLQAHEG